ncbi:DNA topoisomerase VI subunit B [Methanocella arvoryzae]|uniref:Type 2 DNA topoisomerase 6 subunit B n=1 Tax=Methanocella arvoryzae (strain DSM 22066 / NBRC 105507 / MRE50) TaxID=351160 RepID=Q0W5E8_METAR|nr:DNA topoisomerase VI subunit B [Methanocella arvoryzae]CAJ36395.1 type II DNA topoisomerase VI, subunit B [Methanocella arvoryzae MRE50]
MAPKNCKTAKELAKEMKEISFSEFIATNPHLVGFESSVKMIPMSIHEILTNSLDACESAGILPEVWIDLKSLDDKGRLKRYKLTVRDNGPGILPKNVPLVFGKLLYGSKFGVRRQSRGQQGIGVSAVVLISQIKTGEHAIVKTSTNGKKSHVFELSVDVDRNSAKVHDSHEEKAEGWKGVEISVILEAQFSARIMEYIELTAAINPHLSLHYDGVNEADRLEVPRRTEELPAIPVETKPHPSGADYDLLKRLAARTRYSTLNDFLKGEFDRVRSDVSKQIIAGCKDRLDVRKKPADLCKEELMALAEAMSGAQTLPPSTECLSPVGEATLVQGVVSRLQPAFIEAVTRKPRAMRGQPFLVEVIIAYGCGAELGGTGESSIDPVTGVYIHRFVNRVPLLFSESGDVTLKAARDAGLARYEIAPETRSHLFVHVAGVNIPYTSESKEAIKFVDEYYEEIRLAIQECGRKISKHIRRIKKSEEEAVKGKRKAIIHSLLLRQLNRYAGAKVAGPEYAAAFGFDNCVSEVEEEYGLDVFREEKPERRAPESRRAVAAAGGD